MEKSQNFFDPYNFSMQQNNNMHGQMQQPEIIPGVENPMNPSMYYEQQYMYYRYLTQMLEYKTRLKEYERLSQNENKPQK